MIRPPCMPIPSSEMVDRQKVRHEPRTREPRTHRRRLAGGPPRFEEETDLVSPSPRLCISPGQIMSLHGGSELRQEIVVEAVTSPCKIVQMAHGRQ